jgi:hypothetical protein
MSSIPRSVVVDASSAVLATSKQPKTSASQRRIPPLVEVLATRTPHCPDQRSLAAWEQGDTVSRQLYHAKKRLEDAHSDPALIAALECYRRVVYACQAFPQMTCEPFADLVFSAQYSVPTLLDALDYGERPALQPFAHAIADLTERAAILMQYADNLTASYPEHQRDIARLTHAWAHLFTMHLPTDVRAAIIDYCAWQLSRFEPGVRA